ncbi:MAG: aromatic amino acid ammonia-lyase, partial [Candidatus Brocadiia bacterium]
MTVVLSGANLTIDKVVAVARFGEKVEIAPEAVERMRKCRALLEEKVAAGETMYGVNTGIGEFSEVALNDEQTRQFQRYLIYNHAAGIGKPFPIEVVRAAMTSRINVLSHGNSGCRPIIAQTYAEMLNKGVTPVVCEKGSVGACGDLAPMSQIALTLMGEGEVFFEGERMPTTKAFSKAGIAVPGLEVRDGLAAINGSNVIAGFGSIELYDSERLLLQAEIAASMSLAAL